MTTHSHETFHDYLHLTILEDRFVISTEKGNLTIKIKKVTNSIKVQQHPESAEVSDKHTCRRTLPPTLRSNDYRIFLNRFLETGRRCEPWQSTDEGPETRVASSPLSDSLHSNSTSSSSPRDRNPGIWMTL